MPLFSNAPPADQTPHNYDLVRCPPAGKIVACITCPDLVGCPTHFYRGHTIPCEPPLCAACQEGLPWRWHGYVTIYTDKSHFHQLFELTAPAAEPLTAYREQHGTLRGCVLTASRISPRPNGRVRITTRTADLTNIVLPEPPDLRLILATLWNMPELAQEIRGTIKNHPRFNPKSQSLLPDDHGPTPIATLLNMEKNRPCKSTNGSRGD